MSKGGLTKEKIQEIATRLGVSWVEFDDKTGRHTFTRKRYKTITQINRNGTIAIRGGLVSGQWTPGASEVWEEYECYPDQIDNGDLEYFIKNGLSQTGPRPYDEEEKDQ